MSVVQVSITIDGEEVIKESYASATIEHKRNLITKYGTQYYNYGQAVSSEVEKGSEVTVITLSDKI